MLKLFVKNKKIHIFVLYNTNHMKKTILSLILIFSLGLFLQSCQTQKGYNYSKHKKQGQSMHRKTHRVNKGNNQLNHKCTPH